MRARSRLHHRARARAPCPAPSSAAVAQNLTRVHPVAPCALATRRITRRPLDAHRRVTCQGRVQIYQLQHPGSPQTRRACFLALSTIRPRVLRPLIHLNPPLGSRTLCLSRDALISLRSSPATHILSTTHPKPKQPELSMTRYPARPLRLLLSQAPTSQSRPRSSRSSCRP